MSAPVADAAALDALASARARDELRRESVRRELRLAAHDFAEGLRGLIRISPLAAVSAGIALGVLVSRRRRRKRRVG